MSGHNTPLDSLKHTALRATEGMGGATDSICGRMCSDDHESDLEWFDSIKNGWWLALADHIDGVTIDAFGLVAMTPAARKAVHTYDDGTPVLIHVRHPSGHYSTDYYPRFDGPYEPFVERFMDWCVVTTAERIAYEAAHPAPVDGGDA